MAGAVALLVAGVVLAGCSEPEAPEEPLPPEEPERERLSRPGRGSDRDAEERPPEDWEENATVRVFSEEFVLSATAASSLFGFGGFGFTGADCVAVEGAPFTILGGNATLTWSAQTPAAERLALVVRQVSGDYYYDHLPGMSPLEVEIPELPSAEAGPSAYDDGYYVFAVDAGDLASVAFQQEVRLALEFEYLALDDVASGPGC